MKLPSLPFWKLLSLVLFLLAGLAQASDFSDRYPAVQRIFPGADAFGELEGTPPSAAVYRDGQVIGYVFQTFDVLRVPAYSGKPINNLVGIDLAGRIVGLTIVEHDEPILAVGISHERLDRYVQQYAGQSVFDKVIIGAPRAGHVNIDGISGATITVMVENSTIMRAARAVAESRGIDAQAAAQGQSAPAAPAVVTPATPHESQEAPAAVAAARSVTESAPPPAAESAPAPGASSAPMAHAPAARPAPTAVPPVARATTVPSPLPPLRATAVSTLPGPLAGGLLADEAEPAWVAIWQNRKFDITVLVIGLATLFSLLIFQDWLVRRPKLLAWVRNGFHVYTLFFIGWWGLAQLSVLNVLTFVGSIMQGFRWENFLIDPMLFILWTFVAMTLLLWGRGVYCGWLCPFGALQELIHNLARRLRLPQLEFSDAVHERLVALKYLILILLFGLSLQSMTQAAGYAEVEPFKTVFPLRFQREWTFVAYALGLILLSAFNSKFYCKYLCPLGAALAIPGRFRLFDWWLRRRKECGHPCQVCAHQCSVRAIRPTGEINANECHYCLDCQVIYYDDHKCLPLIERRKRREQQMQRARDAHAKQAAGQAASTPAISSDPRVPG